MPKQIDFTDGRKIEYVYDASGVKLQTKHTKPGESPTTTDYFANRISEDGVLKMIRTEEGYAVPNGSNGFNRYYYIKDHLGNNRVVMNENGGVEQVTNYYPFGTTFAENPARTDQDVQRFKFGGKELDRMFGLDMYDFEARMYSPVLGRFMQPDPMAEKYYSVSPYAYCANNPVRYIDPTGMEFTDAAWKQISRLIDDINRMQEKNSQEIAKRQVKLDAGGLSDKQTAKLQKQINKFSANSSDLEGVRGEIATLSASSQMYDIKMNNSMNISGSIPGTGEERGGAVFNFNNGNFEITLGSSSLGMLAHELNHAYQFETGAFSSGYMRDGTPFYDQSDEWAAYARGALFGGERISSLPSIYNNLQSGPMDATKLAPIILNNPSELQKIANRTRSAFRINGVTYKMQGGRP